MKWQRKIQGNLPAILNYVLFRDFTEDQLRAYFTKDDSFWRRLVKVGIGVSMAFACAGLVFHVYYLWFALASLLTLCIAGIASLIIKLGIQVPTDEEYEKWLEKKADEELQKGLVEIDMEHLSKEKRERMLYVRGYAVPGTKDEKNFLKNDILWKKGNDGNMHYSINIYTYVIPLDHQFASLTFHVNAVNFKDRSQGIGEHFYNGIVSIQTRDEREQVKIDEAEYLYRTQSFLLSSSDGKGITVTIRSLPLARVSRDIKLPEFGFADPRVEDTIRQMRRLLRSIKQIHA